MSEDDERTLDRLEGLLRQDPANLSLLAQAFKRSLRLGRLDGAQQHLIKALSIEPTSIEWRLREAHLCMARHDWARAWKGLTAVSRESDQPPSAPLALAVAGDMAYVALNQGALEVGIDALQAAIDSAGPTGALPRPIGQTWLRLLHRMGRIEKAMAWSAARWHAGTLDPATAGVASLVALDAEDFQACRTWSDAALQSTATASLEALVASAGLALGRQDAREATRLLDSALRLDPSDGRTLSSKAFATLLSGDPRAARAQFESAVRALPEHIGTWHGLGWSSLLDGDPRAARLAFEAALELDRNFAESHGGLAVAQANLGQREQALESIERARLLDRNGAAAGYAVAVLDGVAQSADAVRRLAESALKRAAKVGSSPS